MSDPIEEQTSVEVGTGKGEIVARCSPELSGAQRRHLRALGHHLKPTVMMGERGLHEGVLKQVDRALYDHELIKVKVLGGSPSDRAAAADAFFSSLSGQTVQVIGNILLVFRHNPDEPKIVLPQKGQKP